MRLGVTGVEGWRICPLGQGPACALGVRLAGTPSGIFNDTAFYTAAVVEDAVALD